MSKNFIAVAIFLIVLGGLLAFSSFRNPQPSDIQNQIQDNTTTVSELPKEDICTNDKEILITPEKLGNTPVNGATSNPIDAAKIVLETLNNCPNNLSAIEKIVIPDLEIQYDQETKTGYFKKKSEKNIGLVNWSKTADFDGDGTNEIVLGLINSFSKTEYGGGFNIGLLAIFKKNNSEYSLSFSESPIEGLPEFKTIEDINKDGKTELVFVTRLCGAHTCSWSAKVLQWSNNKWISLGEGGTTDSSIEIKDVDNDGIKEIVAHGGLVASAGAGNKQREATLIYKYNPITKKYGLSEKIYDPIEDNYFRMLDIYYALKKNDTEKAQKIIDDTLQKPRWQIFSSKFGVESSEQSPESYAENASAQKINAYIYNEIMLNYIAKNGEIGLLGTLFTLDQMEAEFEKIANHGAQPYIEGARALHEVFKTTKDYKLACQAMEDKIASYGEQAEFFNWYGYNEEHIKPSETCPL